MKKPPTKREREQAFTDHNREQFVRSVDRVQRALRKLDCAIAEARLYADLIAPRKGGKK